MKTNIGFWSYLVHFFLEWKMFWDKICRENRNTHFIFSYFFRQLCNSSARNCYTTSDVWFGALSWCRNHSPCLLCSNSSSRKAFLSSPNHRTLRILLWVTFGCFLLWNGPQEGAFRNHGGHQIKCNGRTPEDSKRSLPPVLPTKAGSMEQVCVCGRVLLWRLSYVLPFQCYTTFPRTFW
jgi:hypothetical protein